MMPEYKTDKATRVLMLYHKLLQGEHIDKTAFSIEHGINQRTFDRDIEDIRLFLSDSYSVEEIVYNSETKTYYMPGQRMRPMDRMEAAIIIKILLSSKLLREDEMKGLVDSILSLVNQSDKSILLEYLGEEQDRYSSQEKEAIIKLIIDLYSVIAHGMDIEITVNENGQITDNKKISPIDIIIENSVFYLICVEPLKSEMTIKYPIHNITGFKLGNTAFASGYKKKYYEEKEK